MSYTIDNPLVDLKGLSPIDLMEALEKLREKEKKHSTDEPMWITKARRRFIKQIQESLQGKTMKGKCTEEYKNLIVKDITELQWNKLRTRYFTNKFLLKNNKLNGERRKRCEEFNQWFESNRPTPKKRGRPRKKTSTVC
jgi:hypothetical protein